MLMTSGYNFEGYDIVEYYGHESAAVVLGTGFLSSTNVAIADLFGTTSNSYEDKLNKAEKIGKERLAHKALQRGCNAIIGVDVDYTTFTNDVMGVIVNGTLVKVTKQVSDNRRKNYVNNQFNLTCGIRCLDSVLRTLGEEKVYLQISGKKYFKETIDAIEVSMFITTVFGDSYSIDKIMFADLDEYNDLYSTEYILLDDLTAKESKLIKKIEIVITKFVSNGKIVEVDKDKNMFSSLSDDALKNLRNQIRVDAIQKPYKNEERWNCCCGKENMLDTNVCSFCKQNVDIESLKFILMQPHSEEENNLELQIKDAICNCSTAKDLYNYLLSDEKLNEDYYAEMFMRLKKIQANERIYGNSKEDAIKVIKEYFPTI